MSVTNNLGDFLTNLANAIRTKKGTSSAINAQSFANEIAAIETGTDTSDATALASNILSGKTAYVNGSKITGTIASKSAATYTPSTANQSIAAGQYLSGAQTISGDSNLVASNIKSGVSIFGVSGTYSVSLPTLNAPSLSISGSTLTITQSANNGNFASGFRVYNGATLIATTSGTTVDLSSYITAVGSYTITAKAYGTNFNDSAASSSVTYTIQPVQLSSPVLQLSGSALSWGAVSHASGYLISYAGAASGTQSVSAGTSSYDLEGLLATSGTYTVTVTAKGTGDYTNSNPSNAVTYSINYSVTNTLANCTSNNSAASVLPGASYSATLTAASGYTLTGATASVIMGGVDITSTAYSAGVITISSVTGAIAITVSAIQSAPIVSVGQLITMNLDGTDRQYRVLKLSGEQAEVVCMSKVGDSTFGATSTYAGSALDTYLNSTWYDTLTASAKAAIVSKTFNQDSWYWGTSGSSVYSGHCGTTVPGTTSYSISKVSATYGAQITRNVYALSVQDVIDYITNTDVGDGELENYNIWNMFWDTTTQPSISESPWLRSARANDSSLAWLVSRYLGRVDDVTVSYEYAVRPALTIDLSKISWAPIYDGSGAADFATDDWSIVQLEAQRISEMGTAEGSPYSVGDTRTITLSTNEVITVVILGFNHDTLATAYDNGGTLSGISIGMDNCLVATSNMNSSSPSTNSGGWGSSEMRTAMATYLSQLPAAVQSVIAPVVKKTSAGSKSSTINNSTDSLWLYSSEEVIGTHMQHVTHQTAFSGEGEQYDYFKLATIPSGCGTAVSGTTGTYVGNNAKYTDRFGKSRTASSGLYLNTNNFKGLGNSPTASDIWWLRSPNSERTTAFCSISWNGSLSYETASGSHAVAFGFCI